MTSMITITTMMIDADHQTFWQAANQGKLMLKRCIDSGRPFYPPRRFSPFTGSERTDWIEACGRGTLYSFSQTWRNGVEHCLAYIELAEGPIIMSNLIDYQSDAIVIGMAVELRFVVDPRGQSIPVFGPARS